MQQVVTQETRSGKLKPRLFLTVWGNQALGVYSYILTSSLDGGF